MAAQQKVDWNVLEPHYRAGARSLTGIGAEFGVSHSAIIKQAKNRGWEREAKRGQKVVLPAVEEPIRAGFVYVIYLDDSAGERFYKIGTATVFSARFDQHQCSSPFYICVACAYFVGDMRVEERALHALFEAKRVRGEWFRLTAKDLLAIAQRALLL